MNDGHGVPQAVRNRWEDLIADTEATAAEYEESGYDAVAVHPGDVVAIVDDRLIEVLVPGDEYRELSDLATDLSVDEFDVYGAEEGGVAFSLVAALDHDAAVAVCVPLYLSLQDTDDLDLAAEEAGDVHVHVRPLSDDSRVAFTLEEPGLLL